jgi:hypothetical protein
MAWKAGAELTKMESTGMIMIATGLKHKWYSGAGDASYETSLSWMPTASGCRIPSRVGWTQAPWFRRPELKQKSAKES